MMSMMSIFSRFRPLLLTGLFLSTLLSSFLFFSGDRIQAAVPLTVSKSDAASLTDGVKQTVLSNGLTVLTKEVHTTPVVSVQVWYRVGSRNEGKGINGLSHQLEHLLFKGTKDRPIQFGRLFSALGSESNAFTSYDETAYFGTVEQDKLDALLVLEADRMRNALNSAEYLASEKKVVISELQGYENSPGYRLGRAVMRSAFPNRTYGLPVGGTKADVEKFTVDQVQQYYKAYYRPDNATLVVTGDFDTNTVLGRIKQIYGPIPKPAEPLLSQPAKGLGVSANGAKKPSSPIVLKEPGSNPLLSVVYPLPDANHPDVPAIDVMDAILTGGRSSRLYQALVEPGLASSVSASASEPIEPGWYEISVTPAAGQSLTQAEKTLQQTLSAFRQQSVSSEELERAKTQLQASFIFGNQDITSQANQLGFTQTVTGDYRFTDRYLAAIKRVTAADVQRVARAYLKPEVQTVGFFEPTLASGKPGASGAGTGKTSENFSPGAPVDPAQVAKYLPPTTSAQSKSETRLPQTFALSNGVKVLLLSDRSTPTINLSGHIQAGAIFDTSQKAGLAGLTASNLMNGTTTKDALTLAKTLEDRGAGLGFGASREGVSISGNALAQDVPILIQTLADVVQHATFPEQQLELSRQRALIGLKAVLDDPRQLGRRAFQQAIYPANHPFSTFPTEESLKQITQQDLVQFYRQYYRPDGTVLAIVGDFDPAKMRSLLETSLGQWKEVGQPAMPTFPTVTLPKATTYLSKTIPGKAESVTYLGYSSISRKDPRYYAALVMNQVLGGSTLSSRLGDEVRDRQGLTYGIYSGFAAGIYPGPFLISMQTAPGDSQRAISSTVALLKQLKETGLTQAELDAAKRSLTSSYPVDLANPSNLADVILGNEVTGLGLEELRQFPAKIEAVTPAQIKQVIEELIQPNNLVILTAGPLEKASK
jgi:zinc protease